MGDENGNWLILLREFAGPVATIVAAIAAAFVAYRLGSGQLAAAQSQARTADRNWQTANERVVLELFEKRLAIFEGIRAIIGKVLQSGKCGDELYFDFNKATDRAPYYFGPEVSEYLEHIRYIST